MALVFRDEAWAHVPATAWEELQKEIAADKARIADLEVELGAIEVRRGQVRSALADWRSGLIGGTEMANAIESALTQ